MTKIVLTGGPCAGKSTVIEALKSEFGLGLMVVPEVATLLLSGGFLQPGKDCPWTTCWQENFQFAVANTQLSMEAVVEEEARRRGVKVLVCDRGILDGAAYVEGGVVEFCRRYGFDREVTLGRYDLVLHLESLATACPDGYGQNGNASRFESLEEARNLELRTREAWLGHQNWKFISGWQTINEKTKEVIEVLHCVL